MTGLLLLLVTSGLLALPVWTRGRGRWLPPAEWVKLNTLALVSGLVLMEAAFVECAWPVVTRLAGSPRGHHFFPGGAAAGDVSLALAVMIPITALAGIAGAMRRRRTLRAEPWVGSHFDVGGYDVVLLPGGRDLAVALPGRPGQVLLSRSLVNCLSADQLRAVVRHELAHLEQRHSKYFLLLAALQPFSRVIPVIRSSLGVLRLSLESWADRAACPTRSERRRVQEAIVALSLQDVGPGIASLSEVEGREERIRLLDDTPPSPTKLLVRTSLYTAELVLSVSALVLVLSWWF